MKHNLKYTLQKLSQEVNRRYNNNRLLRYNTGKKVHQKQLDFHKCNKKNRWVFGGNRTGKTECGAVETIWLLRGIHPFKQNKKDVCGWAVSLSTQVQRDVAQSKILSYLNPDWIQEIVMLSGKKDSPSSGIIDKIYIKNVFGGISTLGFKSCDQGREKFQGTSLDFVWFDEEPPYDIYLECKMRVLDRCGEIFGTMTPLKGLTWVYNEIYLNSKKDDEIWYENITWQDNPFLNQTEVKKLMSEMSAEELDARCNGKFTFSGGVVYNNFDETQNVVEPFDVPQDYQDMISIDPGFRNALSCHFYCRDYDGNIFVVAEHYAENQTIEYHANCIKQIAKRLNWKTKNGKLEALIDSAGLQKTLASQKSVVDLFYENDILTNPKVKKDLLVGIQKVKRYICDAGGERRLFIFKNCPNLIREIKSYFWGDDDIPIKKDDHCLDELRYYIMNLDDKKESNQVKSELLSFKNKLSSNLARQKKQKFFS
ncbi:MAG: terminase large subunit domain-containing protein [Christensenellales bacterium]